MKEEGRRRRSRRRRRRRRRSGRRRRRRRIIFELKGYSTFCPAKHYGRIMSRRDCRSILIKQ